MQNQDLESFESVIPHIDPHRKYWLVRTQGGLYYDDFKHNNFIAIGYNPIRLEDMHEARVRDQKAPANFLAQVIKDRIADERLPKYSAQQLLKFAYEIKKGDIVIIPSFNSRQISVGEVQDSKVELDVDAPYHNSPKGGPKACPYIKRRRVEWKKEIKRAELDPILYKLLFSHHIITDGTTYANPIDNLLHDFYIKGKETYLILNVATNRDIAARVLFDTGSILLNLVDAVGEENDLDVDASTVDVKIAVRSPGTIQLSTKSLKTAALVGMIFVGINGGGFKIEEWGIDLSTDGLIKNVVYYQNNAHMRETQQQVIGQHMKKLQITNPKDLLSVLEVLESQQNKSSEKNVKKGPDGEDNR